jgi:hypothetical protein
LDLANLVFEPPASRGSAIQTDFCRPSAASTFDQIAEELGITARHARRSTIAACTWPSADT